nr:protein kinase-like domain-containing protein [Tanacetum cinerariifolium]
MVFHVRCFSIIDAIQINTSKYFTAFTNFDWRRSGNVPSSQNAQDAITEFTNSSLRAFTLAELLEATNNFDESTKIGEGGFGKVHKGVIKSLDNPLIGVSVAVKRSKRGKQTNPRGLNPTTTQTQPSWTIEGWFGAGVNGIGVSRQSMVTADWEYTTSGPQCSSGTSRQPDQRRRQKDKIGDFLAGDKRKPRSSCRQPEEGEYLDVEKQSVEIETQERPYAPSGPTHVPPYPAFVKKNLKVIRTLIR